MKIKDRLSLQFTGIFALIMLLVLTSIYLSANKNGQNNFFDRLHDRALTVAEVFLAEDNLSEEKFKDVQRKYPISLPHEIVRIYNDNYEPVFIKDTAYQWPHMIIDEVRKRSFLRYKENGRQVTGIYYKDNSGDYTVLISAEDVYGHRRMNQLFWSMLLTFIISVVIMFFLGQLFARIALLPIMKVINEVKFIRSTSLNKRLQAKVSKDEINELVITFNNLLEHLEQSFEAQRLFVSNASHELRTPITSIIGDIEVTLMLERSHTEYKQTLRSVLAEAEKLNELINNLFELAQASTDTDDFESIRIDELMWQIKDEWSSVPGSDIEVNYNLPASPDKYIIQGNRQLLFIAIGNIIKNAIKFSDNRKVVCTVYSQHNMLNISIADCGIGIDTTDADKIFRPFYRGANTSRYTGSGIGLSLTEKIFRLHNIMICVNKEYKAGAEFIILVPAKSEK